MSPRKPSPQDTEAPTDKERDERGVIFHGDDGDREPEEEAERGLPVASSDSSGDRGKSDIEREGADRDTGDGDDEVTQPGRG
jgi:hypothetical protein